jgi:hypothetical protein
MPRAESHVFGTIRRSLRERFGMRDPLTAENAVSDGGHGRLLVVRCSLVTAYAAVLGTSVWATCLELDRLPRRGLPVAAEPAAPKPVVLPEDEWRVWARHQTDLQVRVAALISAQPAPPADPVPVATPAPSDTAAETALSPPARAPSASAAKTAWLPPAPALKPAAYNVPEEPAPSSTTGSFWSRLLTLLEPASASTMAGGGDNGRQRHVAVDQAAEVERNLTQRSSERTGDAVDNDGAGDRNPSSDRSSTSDRSTGSKGGAGNERDTGGERSSDSYASAGDDQSIGSDRSARSDRDVAGDRDAGDDRGVAGDRGVGDDRGSAGDRDGRGDRGERGDRGNRGDRGDRGDRDDGGDGDDGGDRGDRGDGGRGRG